MRNVKVFKLTYSKSFEDIKSEIGAVMFLKSKRKNFEWG